MTTPDLWTEATRDVEAEKDQRRVAYVTQAASEVWPFLAAAQSPQEYAARKAMAASRIEAAVETVAERGTGAFERLHAALSANLDADFETLHNSPERVAVRKAAEVQRASQLIGAELMRTAAATPFVKDDGPWFVYTNDGGGGYDKKSGPYNSQAEAENHLTDGGQDFVATEEQIAMHGSKTAAPSLHRAETAKCVRCGSDIHRPANDDRWYGAGTASNSCGDSDDSKAGVHLPASGTRKGGSKTAGEYGGGSPKSGDKATCHKDDLPIQFFDGQWMHLSGGPSHNDVYPATPKERADKQGSRTAANTYVCLYRGKRAEIQAETTYEAQKKAAEQFGAKKTFEVDVMLAQKDGKDVVHDPARLGALIDAITDDDINEVLSGKVGRGRSDFSLSDAKNEAGEWIMSPEQIRSEMAADSEPYNDDLSDDYYDDDEPRRRRGSRHPFDRDPEDTREVTAARDIHDLRRDVGDAMKRYLHPDYHADGQAALDRTHDAVLDHLADMYGWTIEDAKSHKEHHDRIADSVAAHVYETHPFTEHAPPRHHGAYDWACPTCKGKGEVTCPDCNGTGTKGKTSTRHTAEEHGGYHLEEAEGGWFVVNHIGERKNKEPMDHDAALKYQRALMVNVPGAKEDAERHEKNSTLHPDKEPGDHISAFAIASGDWADWGAYFTVVAAGGIKCPMCFGTDVKHNSGGGRGGAAQPDRYTCKTCGADLWGKPNRTGRLVLEAGSIPSGRETDPTWNDFGACTDCNGSGQVPSLSPHDDPDNSGLQTCPTCHGTGIDPGTGMTGGDHRLSHLTRSADGPARPAGDSRHFHLIQPGGGKWHIYRIPRSQVGQGKSRNKAKVSTHDTHEDAVRALNMLKGKTSAYTCVTCGGTNGQHAKWCPEPRQHEAVNTDGKGADRYQRTPTPARPAWVTHWSDDDTRLTEEQTNSARANEVGGNGVVPSQTVRPDRLQHNTYQPVASKIGWLDFQSAQQMLGQLDGHPVALTYDDDFGITTTAGTLSYAGRSVTVTSTNGKAVTVPVQHVLNVSATGFGSSRDPNEGAGRDPGVMDYLMHGNFPSGAMATRHTANPYSPNLNPYTTEGPGHPDQGGEPGDAGNGLDDAGPQGGGGAPTTTRPRVKPSTDYANGGGPGGGAEEPAGFAMQQTPSTSTDSLHAQNTSAPWRAAASLREVEEWYASPARQKVAAKAKAIADDIQTTNPGMGRGQALGFAVQTIRAFPRTVGGIAPSALGGVLDRYLTELSQA